MVNDLKIKQFAHHGLDLLDPGITKFNHFATVQADQVIMLFEAI